MFEGEKVDFDIKKIDQSQVTDGWNSKVCPLTSEFEDKETQLVLTTKQQGYWAYTREALSARSADVRNWLFQRPEAHVRHLVFPPYHKSCY
jgi:hypothetical protein